MNGKHSTKCVTDWMNNIIHCVKSARIWSFSGPHFPAFGQNTERYGEYLRIQYNCGKIRTRKTPNTGTFYAAIACRLKTYFLNFSHCQLTFLCYIHTFLDFKVDIRSLRYLRMHIKFSSSFH